ncbi:hypothetical protein VTI28DRAFT_2272 [Corynascus sepedonium]
MPGKNSNTRHSQRSSKPYIHQDVTSQMSGLSLGAAAHQSNSYAYAEVGKYQYANSSDFGHYATSAPRITGDHYHNNVQSGHTGSYGAESSPAEQLKPAPSSRMGHSRYGPFAPSEKQLVAAYKALAKWEKAVGGPSFKCGAHNESAHAKGIQAKDNGGNVQVQLWEALRPQG